MPQTFIHRILNRQFLGANTLSDLLSAVYEATASNNPGSKIFVQDVSGNMTSFVYANTGSITALAIGVPVYWSNVARTTVTDTVASAITYAASADSAIYSAAGVCISTGITTAIPYAWYTTGGYLAGVPTPSSAKVGDLLVLSNAANTAPSNDVWSRVAVGSAAPTAESVTTLYCVVTTPVTTASANVLVMGTVGLP